MNKRLTKCRGFEAWMDEFHAWPLVATFGIPQTLAFHFSCGRLPGNVTCSHPDSRRLRASLSTSSACK